MSVSSGLSTEAIETWFCEEIEAKKVFECVHDRRADRGGIAVLRPMEPRRSASLAPGTFDDVASRGPVPYALMN